MAEIGGAIQALVYLVVGVALLLVGGVALYFYIRRIGGYRGV